MLIPRIETEELAGKKVLVRLDLDVGTEDFRIIASRETVEYLISSDAKIILMGHLGRPQGKHNSGLSLSTVARRLRRLLAHEVDFVHEVYGFLAKEKVNKLVSGQILLLENLRFDPQEEGNGEVFASELASLGDLYINEAFAVSHRAHASIVGVPKRLPHVAGIRFAKETDNLSKIIENPARPVVVLISGLKTDKIGYIKEFQTFADKILVGGRLPEYVPEEERDHNPKVLYANLNPDKEDITVHSIEAFEAEIAKAKTIVLAGPIGKFEDPGHRLGTQRVFAAIARANAFKVAGGGETHNAIMTFGLEKSFNWISVGGGASLEFLAKGTLPGIEALIH